MKILKLTLVLLAFGTSVFAQSFTKKTKTINLGVSSGFGLGVVGSAEVGVSDDISAGVIAGFSTRSYFGSRYSYLAIGGRGSYHLGRVLKDAGLNMDKIDPYLGLTVGFRKVSYNTSYIDYGGYGTGLFLGGYGGVRYQINEKLGIFAEGGYPLSSLGITFKL